MTAFHILRPRLVAPLSAAARGAVDLLLPPQCLSCGALVDGAAALCARCWREVAFISPPYCRCCGFPFELGAEAALADGLCGGCLGDPPPFERARAVFRYDAASRDLVLGFKHADKTHGAPAYAAWMARAAGPLLAEADVVAPVPLHRLRLFARRYNQAALLALALAREGARPCWPNLLVRTRPTPSQGRLSPSRRRRNVRGAFAVRPSFRASLADRRVLLVDDVMTTGATVESAARTLIRAGAAAVDVVTLARVVRPAA